MYNAGSAEVLCAEVVFNPLQLYINVNQADDVLLPDAIHFLYTIRYHIRPTRGSSYHSFHQLFDKNRVFIVLRGNPSQSYGASPVIWDRTMLPVT